MYQTMEELLGTKKKSSDPKDIHVYIWNGRKIHFRGPVEFNDGDKIEMRIDKDNNKILFMNNGTDNYCRKFAAENKTGSGSISFKKALELVDIKGTISYGVKKIEDDAIKNALGLKEDQIAYEVDLNTPIPIKSKTPKEATI